ncbi:hypothetical protein BGX28_002923 [Mortierella sp. GBA30]|nr:hypothetical protein BGX28_002923 [Mortierella sp. GBA30]
MCQEIAAVYAEHGQLLNRLGERERAQVSFRKADKWNVSSLMSGHFSQENKRETDRSDIANVSPEIFSQNVARPIAKHYLPKSDERIANTPQLVYCLNLLSKIPLSSPTAEELEEPLDDAERTWIQSKAEDRDEQDRLRSLSTKLIVEFIDDDLKDSSAIAEVVCLAPILDQVHYRKLLSHFIDNIENSALLHFDMLEGLAQLIHSASTGYLHADDLVRILHVLKIRLQDTHKQSTEHLYQLAAAVSNVLDAMADCNVKGLDRERLHAPLAAYLDRLKNSSDPYLVYHAAYASQALLYVPDNETPLQSVTRRTRVLLTGIFGMASAVRSLDVNGFIDGLEQLQGGLTDVYRVVKIGCEGVTSLVEGGQGLLESLMEGLSFSQKRAWYPALRGIDILLADGRVADFKKLVCEAPDRRDPAFQWGLCQRLSEIASNSVWDASARKSAIEFLGDLYRNDMDWGQHASVKQRIIIVLIQLADMPDRTVLDHAHTLLHDLERNGAAAKQALYHSIRTGPKTSYVLKSGLSPGASMLLDRVQDIPDIEDDLRKLRNQRLEERSRNVYIPPQAKSSLQASDASLFPLMGKVNDFLNSDRRVLLLLGDSGAGKSTFSRALECDLWSVYKKDGRIPLHINLPAIDRPEKDLIAKHLRRNDFTEAQIREIKYHRELVVICDGYDESQLSNNLYTSNQLNKQSQWRVKMVISCRSEYLPQDYRDRFQPTVQNRGATSSLFQEAVIVPFSEAQIEDYIKQYVSLNRPQWRLKDYLQALDGLPNLMDLVKNPFLLTLSLEVLPRVVDLSQIHDLSGTKVTRVALFDQFVEQWLERGKKRARSRDLSPQAKTAFDSLVDEGFTQSGIHFLKRLAAAIYREQEGHPVVEYSRLRDDQTWKSAFFSREDEIRILREASPISRSGNQFRFIHRSLMEYCFSLAVFDPQDGRPSIVMEKLRG